MILLTVYRRYHELTRAIEGVWRAWKAGEFRQKPEVWVVWAQPEVSRLWFFQGLLARGEVHRVVGRPRLAGEGPGRPTTYPESHNLRLGLSQLSREGGGGPEVYVIGQAGDVLPNPDTYRFLDDRLHGVPMPGEPDEGEWKAVVFHLQNPSVHHDIWHTNFFAVPLDERYWPPVCGEDHADVLERQWGALLAQTKPERVFRSSNYNAKRFHHDHLSESLPAFPVVPQLGSAGFGLSVVALPWWGRLRERAVRLRERAARLVRRCIRL